MRSKGSRFTLGVWGLRVCSLDVYVRNRSQPSTTVRSRSRAVAWGLYGRAYGEFCKSCHFWTFPMPRSLVSRGRRGFTNRIVRAASSGDTVQIAWQSWHFVRCAEIDGSLARKIDFEVANFHVLKISRKKTSILKLQSVKIGESLAWNACFDAPTCLVSSLWFSVASPCLWGKLQNLSWFKVSKQVVMWFCVAGVALPVILMCLQTCRSSFCGRRNTFASVSRRWVAFFVADTALWRPPS